MKIDPLVFQPLIDERYISVQKHPTEDLYIYNYTKKCQYEKKWTEETMMCRGLILKGDGTVVARPFKKFFNIEEHDQLPAEAFTVQEKWDGSLGITYWVGHMPFIATRGSFTSDQAIEATKMLQENPLEFTELDPRHTYLFEIIYPENRIVVDYKGARGLTLLAVIDIETGEELDHADFLPTFVHADYINGIDDLSRIREKQETNKEGYVIRFQSGLRVKAKFEEYVRLHRLVTGVNKKTIWELMKNHQEFDELLDRVPDEFFRWIQEARADLAYQYKIIENICQSRYERVRVMSTRKEQAKYILSNISSYSGVAFAMLDNKPYEEIIWKMIRPKADRPFKEDEV